MARTAEDARDVLGHAELTAMRVYELTGRRRDVAETGTQPEVFRVYVHGDNRYIETRARLELLTDEADLTAEVGAVYTFDEDLDIPSHVAAEFIERVGIMTVYPFVREQIFTTATRLGVAPPVLGLLRAGQFTVEAESDARPIEK